MRSNNDLVGLEDIAKDIRHFVINMLYKANSGHAGSALSCVDILTVLYFEIMNINANNPSAEDRDRFILSKGHASSALYAILAEKGFFSKDYLMNHYLVNQSPFTAHTNYYNVPGIEVATGSLGHGLSIGIGISLAAKIDNNKYKTFVLMSDGECDEGSTWESILAAPQLELDNLVAIVDYNKIQSYGTVSEVMELEPFAEKWKAFRWSVKEVNGHSISELVDALKSVPFEARKPSVIIAHTIKGKGISFMENTVEWHYWSLNEETYQRAIRELSK